MSKAALKVVVTGGAGNIGGFAAFALAKGSMLGPDQPIDLRLLEIPQAEQKLQGVVMELNDGCFPLLTSVIGTSDYKTAFADVDIAMLIGAKPRSPGEDRADLLKANAKIFQGQGKALNQYASRNVKIVVVGNPANTNCLIAMHNAPNLSPSCFSALTRLDQNRAVSMLSSKTGVPNRQIKNVTIWGNHSNTMYADVNQAYVVDEKGTKRTMRSCVNDDAWLDGDSGFIKKVAGRGTEILEVRGKSSAASAANAAVDHVRSWVMGTAPGEFVNMAIPSDGSYGIPKGLVYSFPVTISNGNVSIVQGITVDSKSRARMDKTKEELLSEKQVALGTPAKM